MPRRHDATAATFTLVCAMLIAGCAGGTDQDNPRTTAPETSVADRSGPGRTGGGQRDGDPGDRVIGAPIKVPPFGGDREFDNTVDGFHALITERCGGQLCLAIVHDVTPVDAVAPFGDCELTGIVPQGLVARGATVTLTIDCSLREEGETTDPTAGATTAGGLTPDDTESGSPAP